MIKYVWIPKSPTFPGVYSNNSDAWQLPGGERQPSTKAAAKAKQIETENLEAHNDHKR